MALERAGKASRGATLYVTLEPCHHQGRTPPCTKAVLASKIKRVVIGQLDPNPHVVGGGAEFLARTGLKVDVGIMEQACLALNEYFNKHVTTGRPFVLVKSAATLDGKLATVKGHSRWVTGEKARAFVHHLRDGVDAILAGRGTILKDDPRLNTRLPGRKDSKDPVRVVLDTRLRLPIKSRVFDPESGGPTIVACGPKPPLTKVRLLEKRGVEVLPLSLYQGRVSLSSLIEELGTRNILSLLIEGGSEVNAAALMDERIVDKVLFFYAPKVVGGRKAPTLVGGPGVERMDQSLNVEILKTRRLGSDLLIEARPLYT